LESRRYNGKLLKEQSDAVQETLKATPVKVREKIETGLLHRTATGTHWLSIRCRPSNTLEDFKYFFFAHHGYFYDG